MSTALEAHTRPSSRGARHTDVRAEQRSAVCSPHDDLQSETPRGHAHVLGSYRGETEQRQVVSFERLDGRTLVLDARQGSLADARVIAVLFPEEPAENAASLARMYMSDRARGRARALEPQDLLGSAGIASASATSPPALLEAKGSLYAIAPCVTRAARCELRWARVAATPNGRLQPLTLRDVIGALEDYEPPRTMTAAALRGPWPRHVGRACLSLELSRLLRSSIVLNRGLREAVEREVRAGISMSEIAMRCGRLKADRNGNRSGETSWLARRIGQMPEGGQTHPTPWIHSDTLALIARNGLALSPREVEL